jgi:hypothetical protein
MSLKIVKIEKTSAESGIKLQMCLINSGKDFPCQFIYFGHCLKEGSVRRAFRLQMDIFQ